MALLPIVLLAGCSNSCFSGFFAPSNGSIGVVSGNPGSACTLTNTKSTLKVIVRAVRSCESCSESNRSQHVLVTLRGIQLHPKTSSGDGPVEWEEIFPQLENHPLQVDLRNAPENELAAQLGGEVPTVPSGTYDRVRLLFVPNPGGSHNQFPAENACGAPGLNCVFNADGGVQPLVFDGDSLGLRISSETEADGLVFIPPDGGGELFIGLTPVWFLGASPGGSSSFFPTLRGTARFQLKVPAKESTEP